MHAGRQQACSHGQGDQGCCVVNGALAHHTRVLVGWGDQSELGRVIGKYTRCPAHLQGGLEGELAMSYTC